MIIRMSTADTSYIWQHVAKRALDVPDTRAGWAAMPTYKRYIGGINVEALPHGSDYKYKRRKRAVVLLLHGGGPMYSTVQYIPLCRPGG